MWQLAYLEHPATSVPAVSFARATTLIFLVTWEIFWLFFLEPRMKLNSYDGNVGAGRVFESMATGYSIIHAVNVLVL